mmetsp:Transcript_41928/g.100775  ORF Transcript_41928/g.100775 Transcript_41928/m.100775 type:complete len:226 (+) Transcript_41928:84-761(+)
MALQIVVKNTFVNIEEEQTVSSPGHRRIRSWCGASDIPDAPAVKLPDPDTASTAASDHDGESSPVGSGMWAAPAVPPVQEWNDQQMMFWTDNDGSCWGYQDWQMDRRAQQQQHQLQQWPQAEFSWPQSQYFDQTVRVAERPPAPVGPSGAEIEAFVAEFGLDAAAAKMLRTHRSVEVQLEVMEWMRRRVANRKAQQSIRSFSAVFVKRMVMADQAAKTVSRRRGA